MSGEEREVGVVRVPDMWGQGRGVRGLFVTCQGLVRARVRVRLDRLVRGRKLIFEILFWCLLWAVITCSTIVQMTNQKLP